MDHGQANGMEVSYDLGVLMEERVSHREVGEIERLTADLASMGVLVEDDGCGNGWRLLDMDGISLMPPDADSKGLLFEDKGCAWVYWAAMGKPCGARLYSISDPVAEEEDARGIMAHLSVSGRQITRKTFKVIQGDLPE